MKTIKVQKSHDQKEQTSTQVFALLAALVLSALLASGCSVAPVSGNSVDSKNVDYASSSYSNCVQVMTAYGLAYQCNTVATPSTYSYNRYTYSKTALSSKVGEAELRSAYATYLSSLDKAELDAMNAQWAALASSK